MREQSRVWAFSNTTLTALGDDDYHDQQSVHSDAHSAHGTVRSGDGARNNGVN